MMALDDGRVFADFVADIINNRNIIMKSDGSSTRAYCYLADAVIAYFLVMLKGKPGETYNVGNPDAECSVIQLANRLLNIFPEKKLIVIQKEQDNRNYLKSKVNKIIPDIERVKKLGWLPKYNIEEGFMRTVNSYIC
jgi:UDP-glucuronate decarboxylase